MFNPPIIEPARLNAIRGGRANIEQSMPFMPSLATASPLKT